MAVTANFGWKKPADREQLLELLLQQILDEVDADLYAQAGVTAWTAVTFQNGWVNFGSGYAEAKYRKVGDRVEVRGAVKTGTVGTAVFTLPAGFRPPAKIIYTADGNGSYGRLEVGTGGTVTHLTGGNAFFAFAFAFSVTA
jgi:hypothetical protein